MITVTSLEEAQALGADVKIYKDADDSYRCYFAGEIKEPVIDTTAQVIAEYTAAVQLHLDAFAQTRNYDGILSAATYATSTVPKFLAEGQYAVEARDATWAACYSILADVQGGVMAMPTLAELLAELPVLVWPV